MTSVAIGKDDSPNVSPFTGIRVWGNKLAVRRNLVTMTLWPGSYKDREEHYNFDWNAAIEVCGLTRDEKHIYKRKFCFTFEIYHLSK